MARRASGSNQEMQGSSVWRGGGGDGQIHKTGGALYGVFCAPGFLLAVREERVRRHSFPSRVLIARFQVVNRRQAGGRNRDKDSLVARVSNIQVVGGERPAEFSSFLPPACLRLTARSLTFSEDEPFDP